MYHIASLCGGVFIGITPGGSRGRTAPFCYSLPDVGRFPDCILLFLLQLQPQESHERVEVEWKETCCCCCWTGIAGPLIVHVVHGHCSFVWTEKRDTSGAEVYSSDENEWMDGWMDVNASGLT